MTRYEQITRLAAQLDITWAEAETLRRCSMTLSRWAELECGDSNDYQSWAIERDEETNKPYMVHYPHNGKPYRRPIPDMEAGALKRVEAICKANGLHFYHKRTLAVRHLYISREPLTDSTYTRGNCGVQVRLTNWVRGSDLSPDIQRQVLAAYVYRNTRENRKQRPYVFKLQRIAGRPVSDAVWLKRHRFALTQDGTALDTRVKRCCSL